MIVLLLVNRCLLDERVLITHERATLQPPYVLG